MIRSKKTEPGTDSKKRPRGRLKGHRITVQPSNVISGLVDRLGLTGAILTFQDVADSLTARSGIQVTRGTVWRFANKEKEPHKANLRAALGLPVTVPVAVCPDCGQPPLSKRHKCGDKFERNAAEYDPWRAAQMPHILDILNWAETPNAPLTDS